jgi:BirA family biotin operon repressor/biotin-[acetyl-CoA-carboxylase] ligase
MKAEILKALRASEKPVSGSTLCAQLGSSRVAVWKHIQRLQGLGYEIEAGPKGYTLARDPDLLHPWEFPGREERVFYFPEVSSTMDVAKEMARKGCPGFTVVIAGRQSRGRGRLRRSWHSEDGGLYFTMVLRPTLPAVYGPRLNFLASLVLARVLRAEYGLAAGLKWPNDILVDGRKLCGLLAEMETEGEQVSFVNIGLGVNVNNRPEAFETGAVSIRSLLGREVSRRALLARFLDEFEACIGREDWDRILAEWKSLSVTLNRPVRIVTVREETRGVAIDVDENGALILKQADGSTRAVIFGDCFLQEPADPAAQMGSI